MIRLKTILSEKKIRSTIDTDSKEFKSLKLKTADFTPYVFTKGFPADKKYALILIKKTGKVDVFSANNNMATAQTNLNMWSKRFAYPDEVKSWEIVPMKQIEI
jgi:hypothetical protein